MVGKRAGVSKTILIFLACLLVAFAIAKPFGDWGMFAGSVYKWIGYGVFFGCWSGDCVSTIHQLPVGYSKQVNLTALMASGKNMRCEIARSDNGHPIGTLYTNGTAWRSDLMIVGDCNEGDSQFGACDFTDITIMKDNKVFIEKTISISNLVENYGNTSCKWYYVSLAPGEINTHTQSATGIPDQNYLWPLETSSFGALCQETQLAADIFEPAGKTCSIGEFKQEIVAEHRKYALSLCELIVEDMIAREECVKNALKMGEAG